MQADYIRLSRVFLRIAHLRLESPTQGLFDRNWSRKLTLSIPPTLLTVVPPAPSASTM